MQDPGFTANNLWMFPNILVSEFSYIDVENIRASSDSYIRLWWLAALLDMAAKTLAGHLAASTHPPLSFCIAPRAPGSLIFPIDLRAFTGMLAESVSRGYAIT